MSERHDLIKSNIDSLLLCMITSQPMYGYQIIKELENRSQGYFRFKEGTLYPALHRLEKSGMIEGKWQILPSGQQRKYYYITEKGIATLHEKRSNWNEFLRAMNLIILPSEA
ncbi:MAG: helix-turn-helix transcriptional regulator [Dehalococcoidales bacterium]|nr:helix-turn-helix transcriptional regulator [Dehalococcoidales bacterium]